MLNFKRYPLIVIKNNKNIKTPFVEKKYGLIEELIK